MKPLAALIFLLASSGARADCQDEWLIYHSPSQQLSVRYKDGCYSGDLILSFSAKSTAQGVQETELLFADECPVTKKDKVGGVVEFSCRKQGVSPLAGATYRFKRLSTTIECDGVVSPEEVPAFLCVKGCGKKTPPILFVPEGEGCA